LRSGKSASPLVTEARGKSP
ncbi:macB-like periplasmic core domain protein, partial [Vibrio parahaemolyticus V-223/04]